MSSEGMRSQVARRGVCLVVAAASGTGKSSVLRQVLTLEPALRLSISATTRAPRPGEREGVDYHFTDQSGFGAMVAAGGMLEWAHVFGQCYGTPRGPVEQMLGSGLDVAFDIDWQGHRQVRAALPADVVSVFLLPPSFEALQARLDGRRGDAPDEIARRMDAARHEMAHWGEFDHVVVNDVLADTVATARAILAAARCTRERQVGLDAFVAALGAP